MPFFGRRSFYVEIRIHGVAIVRLKALARVLAADLYIKNYHIRQRDSRTYDIRGREQKSLQLAGSAQMCGDQST